MATPTEADIPFYAEVPEAVKSIAAKIAGLSRPERLEAVRNMVPPPNAICLASGFKCGTTWIQQIIHGLRSGGDMDYDDIDKEVVNLEFSPFGADVCAPQRFQPNMYKTHNSYEDRVKGFSKYIVVTRDPKRAAVSGYWQICGWLISKEELGIDDYVKYFVTSRIPEEISGFSSWYPHRKDPDVLWLHYEDLREDLKACIKLISDFIGIGVDDQELLDLVERQASFEFMKARESKFDDHSLKLLRNEAVGLPKTAGLSNGSTTKVRNGSNLKWEASLSPEMASAIDHRWKSLMGPISPYNSYEEMRAGINKELGRPFGQC